MDERLPGDGGGAAVGVQGPPGPRHETHALPVRCAAERPSGYIYRADGFFFLSHSSVLGERVDPGPPNLLTSVPGDRPPSSGHGFSGTGRTGSRSTPPVAGFNVLMYAHCASAEENERSFRMKRGINVNAPIVGTKRSNITCFPVLSCSIVQLVELPESIVNNIYVMYDHITMLCTLTPIPV